MGDDKKGFEGEADPGQRPAVEICLRDESEPNGCAAGVPLVARFTRYSGPDEDRVKVDGKDEYFVHWRMNSYPPDRDGQYRVRVVIQNLELGHVDVIAMRQNQIRAYNGDLIPISDRGAFKIGFRIEEGALCSAGALGCTTGTEIPGDGEPTVVNVPAQPTGSGQVVAAVVTVNDGAFTDEDGDPVEEVTVSAAVSIDPPSDDVFIDDDLEIPFFVEITTFPSDVYIDPNGPGVEVVVCQDESELANRGIPDALHSQLILYKVHNGETIRLESTFGAPECDGFGAGAPAPGSGFASLVKWGATKVLGFLGPQPLMARRLHGGLNTVVTRGGGEAEAFSTFGAALGPLADSSYATVATEALVGVPVPISIQLRNAIGEDFLLGGDAVYVTVRGANPTATFVATDNGDGTHTASYTPAAAGTDSIDFALVRADGMGLGPLGNSPRIVTVRGLFGTERNRFLSISMVTGAGTPIGPSSGSTLPSLASHPVTGQLFTAGGSGGPVVYTVDPLTGVLTLVGNSGLGFAAIGGMDFRSDGVLFGAVNIAGDGGTGSDHLATINTTTGVATVIGPFGSCSGVPPLPVNGTGSCTLEGMEGIAFDGNGTLWGSLSARGAAGAPGLYTIDASTGAATFVTALDDGLGSPPSGGVVSLEFAADGTLFGGTASAMGAATDGGYLITIDPNTGLFSKVGAVPATPTGRSLGGLTLR